MKKNTPKVAAWLALAAVLFATISPIDMRPPDLFPVNVDRALAFGVLSCLLVISYPSCLKWVVCAAIVGPGAIELLQLFSVTRHAHLEDAIFKVAGSLAGIPLGWAVRQRVTRITANRRRASRRVVFQRFSASTSIQKISIKSRMIDAIYFSPENGQLRIRLSNGHERLFEGVAESEVNAIAEAPSPGNYYLTEFKPRHKRAA